MVGTYIDRAYSAKTDDRPEFQHMIKDSAKKIFKVNLYDNRFSQTLAAIAFTGYGSSVRTSLASCPEFSTNGMLPNAGTGKTEKSIFIKVVRQDSAILDLNRTQNCTPIKLLRQWM